MTRRVTRLALPLIAVFALLTWLTVSCKKDERHANDPWTTGTYTPPPPPAKPLEPLPSFTCIVAREGPDSWRSGAALAPLQDGKVLLSGGRRRNTWLDTAEIVDPSTGKSVPAGRMKNSRVMHDTLPLPDGRILVYGGGAKDLEVYDPRRKSWRVVGRMTDDAVAVAAALLPDGKVYLAGGELTDRRELSRTALSWDPSSGKITRLPDLKQGFKGRAFVTAEGKLALLAQLTESGPFELLATDPSQGTMEAFKAQDAVSKAYMELSKMQWGEKVRLARRADGKLVDPPTGLKDQSLVRYVSSWGEWKSVGKLTCNHDGGDIAGLGADRLLVLGGQSPTDSVMEICTLVAK